MARVVLIVDSSTGKLIDVAGNAREGARYRKFVNRILSTEKNPTLNYGGNGGDTLNVSKNGLNGAAINLYADKVTVSGDLEVGGKSLEEIVSDVTVGFLDDIVGKDGEISVRKTYITDSSSGETRIGIQIALDTEVTDQLSDLNEAVRNLTSYVKKTDIGTAIKDLEVKEDDTLDDVKSTLGTLLERLSELAS